MLTLFALVAGMTYGEMPTPRPVWHNGPAGRTAIVRMQNAPYPHKSRRDGLKENGHVYPRDPHYVDNSVAIFIPRGVTVGPRVDVLVYFHGHLNNVRKALDQYHLREQIVASGKSVILVFPEGPKDAADSGCGKIEEPDGLKKLLNETLDVLAVDAGKRPSLGRVLLAGHSGAYRAIGFCLRQGGLDAAITDVGLLDASYAQLDDYVNWAAGGERRRLFSIFTDHLAPRNVEIMTQFGRKKVRYELYDAADVTDTELAGSRVLFLHASKLNHEQTVGWLERWLRATTLPKTGEAKP